MKNSSLINKYFPPLLLETFNEKVLSVEDFAGRPTIWIIVNSQRLQAQSSLFERLSKNEYKADELGANFIFTRHDETLKGLVRSRNYKVANEQTIWSLLNDFELDAEVFENYLFLTDKNGCILDFKKNVLTDEIDSFVTAAENYRPQTEQDIINFSHPPVSRFRLSGINLVDISPEDSGFSHAMDAALIHTLVPLVHKFINFEISHREPYYLVDHNVCHFRDFSAARYSMLVAMQADTQVLFPEFSNNFYSLQPGEGIVFPTSLIFRKRPESQSKKLLSSHFYDTSGFEIHKQKIKSNLTNMDFCLDHRNATTHYQSYRVSLNHRMPIYKSH